MTKPLWTTLKHLAAVQTGVTLSGEGDPSLPEWPYLRVANVQVGFVDLTEVKTLRLAEDAATSFTLKRGDVLMTEGGDIDKLGRGAIWRGEIANALHQNHVFAVRPGARLLPEFLVYWLDGPVARNYFRLTAKKTTNLAATNKWTLGNLPVACPPVEDQRRIVAYLDKQTAEIDTLIGEQQRLIEMLRERRFALRVNVALHGTAPTEEIESPLPWAEKLPVAWRVVPLTSVAKLESGHTPSRSREDWWRDCYIPWVSLHDVGMMRGVKYLHDTAQRISDAGIAHSSARLLPARTVVLSRDATVGRTAIMDVPMATSQHFAAWVCGPDLDPEYLWVLFGDAMQPFFDSFQNGSTIRTIGMGDLKAFRIPLPPLDEQRRIVGYLDEETAKIDSLIAESERFVELSRERRAALITAAIMGQIDVRLGA